MAKKLFNFKNRKTDQQFNEILFKGLTKENVDQEEMFILTAPDGTEYRLVVDNSGNLSTEEV